MSDSNKVVGVLLIIIAFILFVYALPTMTESVKTNPGSSLENESKTVKNFYSIYDILFSVIPLILFIIGMGLVWKG